ncbi:hypothetical protein F9K91_20470 [Brucella tritici]|uniref:ABC transporter permease n=1 Tax=Brucella tritici TaxID=94626 RepID=A0A7X6FNR4_9HYPH|nr:hypothetical protein [Brucella tritici]KAB2663090.1 hypothetical protein F9K91_20470 [Brucella tritici]NKW09202.1 hypothetical protein [Brucella tritici]
MEVSSLANRLTAPNGFIDQAWPPLVVFVLMITVWEVTTRALEIPVYVLPSPTDIYQAMVQ